MILVGYRSFKSREGKDCYTLNLIFPFRNGSGVGNDIYTQFVDKEVFDQLSPAMVGKKIEFDEVREGRWTRIVGIASLEGGADDPSSKRK